MPRPSDEQYMRRALQLAAHGLGRVSPNPLVGCVIVGPEGDIIGEGYHQQYGGPHAEVNALESIAPERRHLLPQSTVYVTLEPCAHQGKTPPCAHRLVREQVARVVVANADSNPLVDGRGLAVLRAAGIDTTIGVLADEGRYLNRRFFNWIEQQRPYLILKWAQTADGFIAPADGSRRWITSPESRQLVHRWRSEEDAVLVGTNTAIADNPELDVRYWQGRNPTRLLLDLNNSVPGTHHLRQPGPPTFIFQRAVASGGVENFTPKGGLARRGIGPKYHLLDYETEGLWAALLIAIKGHNLQSIIVEGGTQLLNSLLAIPLFDEARIFVSPTNFGQGLPAPAWPAHTESWAESGPDKFFLLQGLSATNNISL
jgi:diaminohydroxyphosphoribosylaminopyrimidine deaminase / 5-amino-6-(5-phosphoribosylamino)uracil reductase